MRFIAAAIISMLVFISPFNANSAGIGEMAPGFSLKDTKGNTVTLDGLKGKVVFLDFWASWCGPCKEEFPELDALYRKHGTDGFQVIAISVDKSEESVSEFLKKRPVSFTVLTDTNGDIAETYGLPGMPTGFIIGRDGIIVHKHAGYSKSFLPVYEKEIVDLLKKQ